MWIDNNSGIAHYYFATKYFFAKRDLYPNQTKLNEQPSNKMK